MESSSIMDERKKLLRSYTLLQQSINTITQIIRTLELEERFYDETIKEYSLRSNHLKESRRLLRKLDLLLKEKNALCKSILSDIEQMESETEKTLLMLKYVEGYTWEEVCERMNYSLRQVFNLHNKALNHFKQT